MFRLWKMYRVLVIGKPTAFYWFIDHGSLRSSGPQNEAGCSLYLFLRLETDFMFLVSAVLVCGVPTITCISCIQRDNFCFQFKYCILSGINITASKGLKQQEYCLIKCVLQNMSAHCTSLVGFLAWIFHIKDFC
jgi:hypothetical protein